MNLLRSSGLGLMAALVLGLSLSAAPDLQEPITELTLTDGTLLKDVSIKSFSRKGVMVRHAGGVAQLAYEQFTGEYREAVLAKRPAGPAGSAGINSSTSTVSVTTSVPAPVRTAAARAASTKAANQRMGTISGSVTLREGRGQKPLDDVEVRAYRVAEFSDWDVNRRRSFSPRHTEMLERFVSKSARGVVTAAEQAEFLTAEYDSWEGVPATPYITRTDASGAFDLTVPVPDAWLVFARTKREVTAGVSAYYVWAVRLNGPDVALNNSNTYPFLKIAASQ